ncbi:hypothetical protein Sked_34750 [Sanguibacter keddieii DSM 10542]|uniref:Uncharacterized protein n=1 Tax=Sanguibacter keddieii (strain ATCC 51767 / DSM 10542 / NCFB 3025 / ST-74) TaxID=446469 RepID=D1BES7_SANKS|nr:hypothetical protein [Sanguibacter keddieii]ACZ23363.1 hypothetical protein Sked_34750 [Sanguibacter keddieii DSM 10542]
MTNPLDDPVAEAADVAAFDEAMSDDAPSIPWAEVQASLGWA